MQIPAAMFIEEAVDMLREGIGASVVADQRKELHVAVGDRATEEFAQGYELGLQTARCLLIQSPKAEQAGVADIL